MEKKLITANDVMALAFKHLKPGPGLEAEEIELLKDLMGYEETNPEDVKPA